MVRVLHVISGLNRGGAETLLSRLVASNAAQASCVVCLGRPGDVSKDLEQQCLPAYHLGLSLNPLQILRALQSVGTIIREFQPNVIQSWLYHGNIFGSLLGLWHRIPVIWSVHNNYTMPGMKKSTLLVRALNRLSSRFLPWRIVYCSSSAMNSHSSHGFTHGKGLVIENGVDVQRFKSHHQPELRKRMGLGPDNFVVGMVARFSPEKDYETFLKAANLFRQRVPEARFILCGAGVRRENQHLARLISQEHLADDCILVEKFEPIEDLYPILDVFSLISHNESFGMVLAESMSCGVPSVASNIEGLRDLAPSNLLVDRGNAENLCEVWLKIYRMSPEERRDHGQIGRSHVIENFNFERTRLEYGRLWTLTVAAFKDRSF